MEPVLVFFGIAAVFGLLFRGIVWLRRRAAARKPDVTEAELCQLDQANRITSAAVIGGIVVWSIARIFSVSSPCSIRRAIQTASSTAGRAVFFSGLAVMISLILDGIADPIVGFISDRWRGKLGRRHPFLYACLLYTSDAADD